MTTEKPESIAAVIARACAEYGVTPGQIAGLANTLSKLPSGPVHDDWEGAARMLSRQLDAEPEAAADNIFPRWSCPFKLGYNDAKAVLDDELGELLELVSGDPDRLEDTVRQEVGELGDKDEVDLLVAFHVLGAIEKMPEPPAPGFHRIGAVLHALASTGSRRGMFALAHHLRVCAAHDSQKPVCGVYLEVAQQWEALALRVRSVVPDWKGNPLGLSPACDRWSSANTWLKRASGRLELLLNDPRYALPGWVPAESHIVKAASATMKTQPGEAVLLDRIGGVAEQDDDTSAWAKIKPWRVLLRPVPVVGRFDPDETYRVLRLEFPWMDEANRRAAEMVAGVRAGRPRIGPLLLTGEPGIGKTAWAARLAQLCELPSTLVSVATGTSMMIAGDEREWASSAPSLPAKVARDSRVANPMIILDELDKSPPMGSSSNASSVHDALLPILDVNETRQYCDLFLQGNLDLARFNWILLSSGLEGLSAPLIDRLIVVHARRPTLAEIDRRLDEMIAAWLPGESVDPAVRRRALAKFEETLSLRDMRSLIEQASLQALWRAPGPRELVAVDEAGE